MTGTPDQSPAVGDDRGASREELALPRHAVRPPVPPLRDLRPTRGAAAAVVAVLLLAAGALAVIEIVLALVGRPPLLVPRDRVAAETIDLTWDDPAVLVTAGAALVVGVLLLALALIPGRPRAVVLASGTPDVALIMSRGALRRLLARDATRVTGVHRARVSLRRRRAVVRVTGRSRINTEARAQVERAVADRIEQLAPVRPALVRVRVRWKEARG